MKKDVVIAVVIGFFIGAFAAITLLNLPLLLKRDEVSRLNSTTNTITPKPTLLVDKSTALEIIEPINGNISSSKTLEIKGKTKASNIVSAISEFDGRVTESSSDGNFSITIKLAEGGNDIYITSINESGDEEVKNLTIFYTSEKI